MINKYENKAKHKLKHKDRLSSEYYVSKRKSCQDGLLIKKYRISICVYRHIRRDFHPRIQQYEYVYSYCMYTRY